MVFPAGSATLSPRVQGAVQSLAHGIAADAQVTVVGRDDDGSSAELADARAKILGATLRAAGVPRSRIVIQQEVAVPGSPGSGVSHIRWSVPARADSAAAVAADSAAAVAADTATKRFDIRVSDGDLSRTLRRWGREHGYQVIWEAPTQAAVQADMNLDAPSFLDAVGQVLGGLQNAGYPLKAVREANNVVRISAVVP